MNETPTSGPMRTSMTHQDVDAISARHSLRSSHASGLCERKEHLFEVRASRRRCPARQIIERPLAANASAAQEEESIAHQLCFGDLVNREEEGSFRADHVTQECG